MLDVMGQGSPSEMEFSRAIKGWNDFWEEGEIFALFLLRQTLLSFRQRVPSRRHWFFYQPIADSDLGRPGVAESTFLNAFKSRRVRTQPATWRSSVGSLRLRTCLISDRMDLDIQQASGCQSRSLELLIVDPRKAGSSILRNSTL